MSKEEQQEEEEEQPGAHKKEEKEEKEEIVAEEKKFKYNPKAEAQKNIDAAISELGQNPDNINDIIKIRRDSNIEVANAAAELYTNRTEKLKNYKELFQQGSQLGGYSKEIAAIDQILAQQETIQSSIVATNTNINNYVSRRSDKKLDQGKENNALMLNSQPYSGYRKIAINHNKWVKVPTLTQLKAELNHTKQAAKIWKGLSKIQGDDDRSKGYAALSDNLASMAMSGVNIGRQGMAMARAFLTYLVADVLYNSLIKQTAKGLVEGGVGSYRGTNKGIKNAANAMYQIAKGADRQLANSIIKQANSIKEELAASIKDKGPLSDKQNILLNALKNLGNEKNIKARADKFLEAIETFNKDVEEDKWLYQKEREIILESGLNHQSIIENDKPSLPTKAAGVVAGVVGAIVGGVVNALYKGVTETGKAILQPNKLRGDDAHEEEGESAGVGGKSLKQRYADLTPEEGESWNKKRSQVEKERETAQQAKGRITYAEKTDPRKFTEMVEKRKEEAKKSNGSKRVRY